MPEASGQAQPRGHLPHSLWPPGPRQSLGYGEGAGP